MPIDLPRTKFDTGRADALRDLPPRELSPHVAELLVWLQDINWPVARPVAAALSLCGEELVDPVRSVLRSDDDIWKLWVLSELLPRVRPEVTAALREDILRIARHPTSSEHSEEADIAADALVSAKADARAGMPPVYTIRDAVSADISTLIAFTLQEAFEAEGVERDPAAVTRGVQGAFRDPPLATYWVAETRGGAVVASTSVVTEWSDFQGGHYWWIQSLFIVPEHRGRGLVELLIDHVANAAAAAGAMDLRLYAHTSNERALRVYRRCGFTAAPYVIMTRSR